MKISRFAQLLTVISVIGMLAIPFAPRIAASEYYPTPQRLSCQSNSVTCTEVLDSIGAYTGHDEPSLLFYSSTAGSGNNLVANLRLPTDPPILPVQDGSGGTFNFQLHPAFWFGMAMCDDQSAPNPGATPPSTTFPSGLPHTNCTPDSDSNIFTGTDPTNPSTYIGAGPGMAFMEMQFYPPGWVAWPPGNSCDPLKWCAALNIDSFSENQNTAQFLNPTCANIVGIEYVNFAFITKSGVAHAPANPFDATLATYTPNPATDLFMNSGDWVQVTMHDTTNGFLVVINDLTSGQSGSMTASAANDFAEIQFAPSPSTSCTAIPTNFHPAFSTSGPNTRLAWTAHSYNVAFSDEIGHFEYCNGINPKTLACNAPGVNDPSGLDSDDFYCFGPSSSTRVRVGGCFGTDADFDGVPYQNTWPGTFTNPTVDQQFHSTSILFTSPLIAGTTNYATAAFEVDLPRIELGVTPPCNRTTGANCVNPPPGATFYPFYTTNTATVPSIGSGTCVWQLGGANIPGTTNTFGGSSTTEFGPLLQLTYPGPHGIIHRYNDFRQILSSNPCLG